MLKRNLIAAVVLAAYVAGERKNIQPGEPVPEIPEHDENELLASGAIVDLDQLAEDDERRAWAESRALGGFAAAREKVAREAESLAAPGPLGQDAPVVLGVDLASGDSIGGLAVVDVSGAAPVVIHSATLDSGSPAGPAAAPAPAPASEPAPAPVEPAPPAVAPPAAAKSAKGKTAR